MTTNLKLGYAQGGNLEYVTLFPNYEDPNPNYLETNKTSKNVGNIWRHIPTYSYTHMIKITKVIHIYNICTSSVV